MKDAKFFQSQIIIVQMFKITVFYNIVEKKILGKTIRIFSWKKRGMINWLILSPQFCHRWKH